MTTAVGDGDDVEKSKRFRWLDGARYAVALVVSLLIVTVIVKAIKVVLRPDSPTFSVHGGSISVRKVQRPPMLLFDVNLQVDNPSGRARMYYVNSTGYLFDRSSPASSPQPDRDCFLYFDLKDNEVPQQGLVQAIKVVEGTRATMTASFFDMLYNKTGAAIRDVTMRLDGVLITEVRSGINTTARHTTYYCGPLLVGGDPGDQSYQNMPDSGCREVQHHAN